MAYFYSLGAAQVHGEAGRALSAWDGAAAVVAATAGQLVHVVLHVKDNDHVRVTPGDCVWLFPSSGLQQHSSGYFDS